MVFYYLTIAIESMVLQSTIGDDGFSMVYEKNDDGCPQIEMVQCYQEHHALLPHAMDS